MEDSVEQFKAVFFEEAAERLAALESNVLLLESGASDAVIGALFRDAHSLKGASATFGFQAIEQLTHTLESLLDRVRSRSLPVDAAFVSLALRAVDVLKGLVAAAREGEPAPAAFVEVSTALSELVDRRPMQHAGVGLDDGVVLFEDVSPAEVDVSTLRVPAAKLDQLVDLVGELVIAQSMLREVLRREGASASHHVSEATAQVERSMRDLQDHCMGVRMVPIGTVFRRFPRLVRDVAASSDKKIELILDGGHTELDKSLVEHLADPLTHLLRNAIDHGIEAPEARAAAGKPEAGVIRMSAAAAGGSVTIEVRDDGRGLDLSKIRRLAVERGLLTSDQQLSDGDVAELIFAPGFSTADAVSTMSGRGVGMEVVKRVIQSLGGSVSVASEPGAGTTIRLKLPLTLAMLSGMSITVGTQTYLLPVLSIVESLRPRREDVKTVLGGGEVLMLRGEVLPILRLHQLFAQQPLVHDAHDAILVIVENEGRRIAIQVDDLLGEQQVVVKSLDTHYRRVDGVMGATVMGDGRVALILDAPSLVRRRVAEA